MAGKTTKKSAAACVDSPEVSKLVTTSIRATSRVSCKLRDNFYTFEFSEERQVPLEVIDKIDLAHEKELLWEHVHAQVDAQVEEITSLYAKGGR